MTNRERILAILQKQKIDRIPWIPRLDIWYEAHRINGTLPEKYRDLSLKDMYGVLGMGNPARDRRKDTYGPNIPTFTGNRIFDVRFRKIERKIEEEPGKTRITYVTPRGKVSSLFESSPELRKKGINGMVTEHLVKNVEDYAVVSFLIENLEFISTPQRFRTFDKETGPDGLPMMYLGQDPMSHIMQELAGYNAFYYHFADFEKAVLYLYKAIYEKWRELWRIASDSSAQLFLHGSHFDSSMTPPPLYKEYMLPYFQEASRYLNSHDKYVACHADADTKHLLDLLKESGFDMLECFVTSPMVSVTMEDARKVFGQKPAIWGGLPSTVLSPAVSGEQFKEYCIELFCTIDPGDAFILGAADNVMPESVFGRVEFLSDVIREFGRYPLDPGRIEEFTRNCNVSELN